MLSFIASRKIDEKPFLEPQQKAIRSWRQWDELKSSWGGCWRIFLGVVESVQGSWTAELQLCGWVRTAGEGRESRR